MPNSVLAFAGTLNIASHKSGHSKEPREQQGINLFKLVRLSFLPGSFVDNRTHFVSVVKFEDVGSVFDFIKDAPDALLRATLQDWCSVSQTAVNGSMLVNLNCQLHGV